MYGSLVAFSKRFRREESKSSDHARSYVDPTTGHWTYYDCCIVTKVRSDNDILTPTQKRWSLAVILSRLKRSGLDCRLFYSIQNDEVYCQILSTLPRLLREAARIKYKLPLHSSRLESTLERGNPPIYQPIHIPAKHPLSSISPTMHIHATPPFDFACGHIRQDVRHLFLRDESVDSEFLLSRNRLQLTLSIIEAHPIRGGAGIHIQQLKMDGCILGLMCLHEPTALSTLERIWMIHSQLPWRSDFDSLRDYFGDQIGLYFLWLGTYTVWSIPAALLGLIAWVATAVTSHGEWICSIYSLLTALWVACFLEAWKRMEVTFSMRWGTSGAEKSERTRPEYIGSPIVSPVTGKLILHFSSSERYKRLAISLIIMLILVTIVIAIVASIITIGIIMRKRRLLTINGISYENIVYNLLFFLAIQVLGVGYNSVAEKLNNFENHRTETEHEDAAILKHFAFQFVNSYAALLYIAVIKPFIPHIDRCENNDCMVELKDTLCVIFICNIIIGLITQTALPLLSKYLNEKDNYKGVSVADMSRISDTEKEFMLEQYSGSEADFVAMVVQLGYTALFVSAFPLAAPVSLLNNYIMLRFSGWKLFYLYQRPIPRTSEDIGQWQNIMEAIGIISIVSNAWLVAFTGPSLNSYSSITRIICFFSSIIFIWLSHKLLSYIVPLAPEEVVIQLARQKYFLSKVIENDEDTDDDDDDEALLNSSHDIDDELMPLLIRKDSSTIDDEESAYLSLYHTIGR